MRRSKQGLREGVALLGSHSLILHRHDAILGYSTPIGVRVTKLVLRGRVTVCCLFLQRINVLKFYGK